MGDVLPFPLDRQHTKSLTVLLWGADGIEPALDALQRHVPHHLAADPGADHSYPGHDLAVVGVDGEGDVDELAVPAGDLEAIGRPALVRGRGNDSAPAGNYPVASTASASP